MPSTRERAFGGGLCLSWRFRLVFHKSFDNTFSVWMQWNIRCFLPSFHGGFSFLGWADDFI